MYLQNAWCVFYAILRQSIVIQSNSIGVFSSGLLAEFPAILDSLFTNTTSDFIGVVSRGWWGAMKWWEKSRQVVTVPYGSIGALASPKSSQFSG